MCQRYNWQNDEYFVLQSSGNYCWLVFQNACTGCVFTNCIIAQVMGYILKLMLELWPSRFRATFNIYRLNNSENQWIKCVRLSVQRAQCDCTKEIDWYTTIISLSYYLRWPFYTGQFSFYRKIISLTSLFWNSPHLYSFVCWFLLLWKNEKY